MQLELADNVAEGPGVRFVGAYPIVEARLTEERMFVVYDWMAFESAAPARNLFCYDRAGKILWRAEDIGHGATDAYTHIIGEQPLWVGNFAGYKCRIDEISGKVLERVFTK